jgi:hypothetical protein
MAMSSGDGTMLNSELGIFDEAQWDCPHCGEPGSVNEPYKTGGKKCELATCLSCGGQWIEPPFVPNVGWSWKAQPTPGGGDGER